MDPCSFVRVLIGNLTLSLPVASRPSLAGVHPTTSPCFCLIRFNNQTLTSPVAIFSNNTDQVNQNLAATFHIKKADLEVLLLKKKSPPKVKISIYSGRRGATCGINSRHLLGKVKVQMSDLVESEEKSIVFVNGWVKIGDGKKDEGKLHLTVRSEPDPRFVFEFDGEPECSPQVVGVNGRFRQPVFTCKFQTNRSNNRHSRSGSLQLEPSSSRKWLNSFNSDTDRHSKERKGWFVTIHDLSGSTVAMASMQTPFVASPGTDRVRSSNPGSWIIFRRGEDCMLKPWGRLEAWRERGGSHDGLGYKFELMPDTNNINGVGISLAESSINMSKGGNFVIDLTGNATLSKNLSPGCSPRGSGDFGFCLCPLSSYRGFVMSSSVEGEGKCSKPRVEIGVQHVGCMEDAAAFVALSAAIDLSMDACKLFSQKLRKEFSGSY